MTQKHKSILIGGIMLAAAGIAGFLYFQNKSSEQTVQLPSICPPVPNEDLPFNHHKIHPDSAVIIEAATGTTLHVPADCFQRADGSRPSTIEFKWREMHNAVSILQSGIPMEVAGTNGDHLQSAGMIEMRAFENGSELIVKQNREIEIELAAYRPSDGYSLYNLEKNKQWNVKDTFQTIENKRKKKKIADIQSQLQVKDSASEDFVFMLDGDTSFQPTLKPFIDIQWKLVDDLKKREIANALRQDWNRILLKTINSKKLVYQITLVLNVANYDDDSLKQTISFLATPLLDGKTGKRAMKKEMEKKMEEYSFQEKQLLTELDRLQQQANLLNTFKVQNMGVYNIDKLMKFESVITHIQFDFETLLTGREADQNVYMVLEEENSVIGYNKSNWKNMSIPSKAPFHFVAVLPHSKLAIVTYEEVKAAMIKNEKKLSLRSIQKPAEEFFRQRQSLASATRL
jgi:hypothetical protein